MAEPITMTILAAVIGALAKKFASDIYDRIKKRLNRLNIEDFTEIIHELNNRISESPESYGWRSIEIVGTNDNPILRVTRIVDRDSGIPAVRDYSTKEEIERLFDGMKRWGWLD